MVLSVVRRFRIDLSRSPRGWRLRARVARSFSSSRRRRLRPACADRQLQTPKGVNYIAPFASGIVVAG